MTKAEAKRRVRAAGCKVREDREWGEWIVTFADGATYHTDDMEDAVHTAEYHAAREESTKVWLSR